MGSVVTVLWRDQLLIGGILFELARNTDGTYTSKPMVKLTDKVVLRAEASPLRYFTVPSQSHPDEPHTVTVYPSGHIACDSKCPGFGFRHKCSHCDTVRAILAEEALHGQETTIKRS